MKKEVNAFDYAGHICKAMPKGILMTTKNGDFVNTMVIGWGHIGIEWGRPIFVAYVRESRHTKTMVENHGEFTVNIPMGEFDSEIIRICGTKSGRDMDKIKELGLHLEDSNVVDVPGIQEFPLTLECKVIYKQKQDLSAVPCEVLKRYYPEGDGVTYAGETRDFHYAYYGEIVGAYLIEE
jgi:flavin reductase (DIM6/NTAB) family NADH-FMN oxidoreductase RutF